MLGKKRKIGEHMINVPMSSMIDVVFLLLIYFIVTQKEEISEAHLAVNLPSPNPLQETKTKPNLLEIEVLPGQGLVQGAPRSLPAMKDTLQYLAKLDPDQTVMIKVSQLARTKDLIQVLDMCKAVGLNQLNVMTLK